MALSDQYPQVYADWIAAGGAEDNFRAHLLALQGGIQPSEADIAWLCNHTATALNQLQAACAKRGAVTGLTSQLIVVAQSAGK
jgi:predicted HicB family RNase H-like nuclease